MSFAIISMLYYDLTVIAVLLFRIVYINVACDFPIKGYEHSHVHIFFVQWNDNISGDVVYSVLVKKHQLDLIR